MHKYLSILISCSLLESPQADCTGLKLPGLWELGHNSHNCSHCGNTHLRILKTTISTQVEEYEMKLIRLGSMESEASSKIRWVGCCNRQIGGTWKRGGKGKETVCLRQPIFYSVTLSVY